MTDVTADERRKVAWRLRSEVSEGECIDYAVFRIINDVLGVNGAWGAKAARILADLIEPTTRTTTFTLDEHSKDGEEVYPTRWWKCARCGEETIMLYDEGEPVACPYCKAVVDDDNE